MTRKSPEVTLLAKAMDTDVAELNELKVSCATPLANAALAPEPSSDGEAVGAFALS